MPGFDRTGPMGGGPMTGWGRGYCGGYRGEYGPYPDGYYGNRGAGFGRKFRRWLGFGRGRGFGRGYAVGFGRGRGFGRGYGSRNVYPAW
jgi:hypothetical protein